MSNPPEPLDEAELLYHYTTWGGLNGILESQCLWAKHSQFLNDSTEGKLFWPELQKDFEPEMDEICSKFEKDKGRIKAADSRVGWNSAVHKETKTLINMLIMPFEELSDGFYITSFCRHNDADHQANGLLSQWRGYGVGGGYAVVFDKVQLVAFLKKEAAIFNHILASIGNVAYECNDRHEYTHEFTEIINNVKKWLRPLYADWRNGTRLSDDTWIDDVLKLIACSFRYKHRGFSEENEVRIMSCLPRKKDAVSEKAEKERCFIMEGKVPIIKLFESPKGKELDCPLPIKEIIVGPQPELERRVEALRIKLMKTDIVIRGSEIPYISR